MANDAVVFTEADFTEIQPQEVPPIDVEFSQQDPMIGGLIALSKSLGKIFQAVPKEKLAVGQTQQIIVCYTAEQFRLASRALGTFTKEVTDSYFNCERHFDGGISIRVCIARATVCTRRVVGYKDIPEKVIPAHKEEIVEWDCKPTVLGSAPVVEKDRQHIGETAEPLPAAKIDPEDDIPF